MGWMVTTIYIREELKTWEHIYEISYRETVEVYNEMIKSITIKANGKILCEM